MNLGGKPAGKVDPKKDPKAAAGAKKGQPIEDKNTPKNVVIDYPEVSASPNYFIYERNYA